MRMSGVWHRFRTLALLSLCASSLCATVYAESRGAELWEVVGSSHGQATPVVRPAPAPREMTAARGTRDSADPARAIPSGVAAPEGVLVPHFEGERLSEALRLADASGLRLVATDEWGDRIGRSEAADYRVRKQRSEPGALVDDGATVKVMVRAFGAALGY